MKRCGKESTAVPQKGKGGRRRCASSRASERASPIPSQPLSMEVRRRRFSEMVDEDHPTVRHCCCFYGWIIWLVVTVGQMSTFYGTSSE